MVIYSQKGPFFVILLIGTTMQIPSVHMQNEFNCQIKGSFVFFANRRTLKSITLPHVTSNRRTLECSDGRYFAKV